MSLELELGIASHLKTLTHRIITEEEKRYIALADEVVRLREKNLELTTDLAIYKIGVALTK